MVWSGFIGGVLDDGIFDVALDQARNVYVVGRTNSDEVDASPSNPADPAFFLDFAFPVLVGPDLSFNSTGLDPSVSQLCTGGPNSGVVCGMASECPGATCSLPPLSDAFVTKVKADGTGLVYSGYVGGAEEDRGLGIAVDIAGSAYIVGVTNSDETTFPATVGPDVTFNSSGLIDPIDPCESSQPPKPPCNFPASDGFVTRVSADGTGIVYAGYIGGAESEHFPRNMGVAVDGNGNAYVSGETAADETTFPNGNGIGAGPGQFPGPGPDLTYNGGLTDAFVAKVAGTAGGATGNGTVSIAGREAKFLFKVRRKTPVDQSRARSSTGRRASGSSAWRSRRS